MTDPRVIDISDEPAALSVRNDQLVIRLGQGDQQREATVPLAELAVLVVAHPAVSYTHAVLTGLAAHGGVLIVCDVKRMPAAMLLGLEGHHAQAERFAAQAHAPIPVGKRLWQQLVRAKIAAQARLLVRLRGDDAGLPALLPSVHSGDPQNVEALAARRYWTALFGKDFRRDREAEDANRLLNYGYAVLRASVARAVSAAGLHPSIGLHHHNRYDAFCLASDLVEPFRPTVDAAVAEYVAVNGTNCPMDKSAKAHLLKIATARYDLSGEWRTLFDVLMRVAVSLAQVFDGARKDLDLPEL